MFSAVFQPDGGPFQFLILAGAFCFVITLAIWIAASVVGRRFREQASQLQTALDNMSQGLLMFDRAGRLVLHNRRYLEMYGLSADDVKPGCTVRDLLNLRIANRTFNQDPDLYIARFVQRATVESNVVELPDGRSILVAGRPMANGGWVATHEDVTLRRKADVLLMEAQRTARRAEHAARTAHQRLLDALDVVSEGLVLFDSQDRIVLWNRRYAEIFADTADLLVPGITFEELLRARIARGDIPESHGRVDAWIEERMAQHRQPTFSDEVQLGDDRWLRFEDHRTADGGSIGVRIDISDLKRRESSFRLLFEDNPVPMWVFDHETLKLLAVNAAAIDHYGFGRDQFLAMSACDLRPDGERARFQNVARVREETGQTWRHFKADGTLIDVAIYSRFLQYEGREASLVAAIDITERKRAENELQRAKTFLDTIVENIPVTLVVKDAREFRYLLINRAGEELFGRSREEMIGKTVFEVFPKDVAKFVTATERQWIESGRRLDMMTQTVENPNRGARLVATKRLLIPDENGMPEYIVGILDDITERKRAEDRVAHMALHDPLTNMPNRAAFNEALALAVEEAARRQETFALMFIDVDHFKEINDVFGHRVGDGLLRELSQRLQAAGEAAFIARLGGDEFTVIAAGDSQPAAAEALAERLLNMVADDIEIEGQPLRVGLSIGVAIFPSDGDDVTTLLSNADAALYRAKADGRGTVRFFEADMDERLRERRALQHDLQRALHRGEISLHYQPQARINGDIIGMEALVRWHPLGHGPVPPTTFIPLAEESGLIISLGEWILREACREAASWPKPLHVAVNLSPVQFRHGDLPGIVHSILLETGLAPHRLELEITEGVLIGEPSRALSILRRLKSLGVQITMDDFGTGYSSLSYLQSFPFDKIKIDRSFISNLDRNQQSGTIIRAVIGLGRGLKLPVVAEGVETTDQLAFLARESCDEIQGYLVGRPHPIASYSDLVGREEAAEPRAAEIL